MWAAAVVVLALLVVAWQGRARWAFAAVPLPLLPGLPPHARVALIALAAQVILLELAPPRRQRVVAIAGHGLVALASCGTLVSQAAFTPLAGLAYAAGFAALLHHAQWSRGPTGWEAIVLALTVVGLGAMSVVYTATMDGWERVLAALPVLAGVSVTCGLAALAILARPPPVPRWLRTRAGILLDVGAHGAAAMALLNALFLAFSLVSGWSLRLVFGILFSWQVMVIALEYRTVRHAARRRARPARPVLARPAARPAITVVVPAANEAAVLPQSMDANLQVRYPLTFVIVPARKSSDATVEVAHRYAREHPDRVRVVEGTTGSKAEDLNVVWPTIRTPYVLLLDADETIDADSLDRAVDALRARPDIGVVQGRKVSRAPGDGWLARFISAERRYSTWLDHVMHSDTLGSAHFGGSAALLRREVPPSVGGWTDQTMTEDIEFTLRVHLDDRWRIVYEPNMIVREADPVSLGELLKQRTRWARGWAQCFGLYFPRVVRERRRLGGARWFGLVLLLLISVSTLWTTFVPATLAMRVVGISPLLPIAIAIPLTLLLLPGRLLAYGYAAFRDPVIPLEATPTRALELALHAYLWILLGWFVQLHALYLEVSSAPRIWYVTGKRAAGARG